MSEFVGGNEREIRMQVYSSYRKLFASAPIRLMSRTVSRMRAMGYADLPTAIGDLDWRTVPAEDPEDPNLRDDWRELLELAFDHVPAWMGQLSEHSMGYNLDSVGYPGVTAAWSGLWRYQLNIDFENPAQGPPQIFVFHGGNQALQAALLGVAEAHRARCGVQTPCTLLVPLPTFSCPLDQIALQGMQAVLLPPRAAGMDLSPEDLDQVPDDTDVAGVYLMPINNPTGRTLPPDRLRALVDAVLARWPHAGLVMDSVYVRLHPSYRELLSWYDQDSRFSDAVMFIDSLSKTHGVTGLRAGALLTRSQRLAAGINRYAQNVMAGPSNAMQAVMLALLAPFATRDAELADSRVRLQMRIGRHLQRRRRLLLEQAFARWGHLFDSEQPVLPDPQGFDWEGSMYADIRLSQQCLELAAAQEIPPTVALYLETGIGGVPLDGFCGNPNLNRHGLVVNSADPVLAAFVDETTRYVRLSFGLTPPPRE